MRMDLGHRGGAGTGTLPLMSLIFDFESNFVPTATQVGPGRRLNASRYEGCSGARLESKAARPWSVTLYLEI